MKVIVTESKIGVEYIADVISSCDQNGIECIVDDNAGEILYYLPKEGRYGDDRLLQNSDESIFDLVKDKEHLANVLMDAQGDKFKEFAVQWNDLQKKGEDEEVYKTQHCNPIRGNFSEKSRNTRPLTAKDREEFEKFRAKRKALGDKLSGLGGRTRNIEIMPDDDDEGDFGIDRRTGSVFVNDHDIGDDMFDEDGNRDWSANEDEIEIRWVIDDSELGIVSGSTETIVVDLDEVDSFEELVYQVSWGIEEKYGGMSFDYDEEWILVDEDKLLKRFGYNMN